MADNGNEISDSTRRTSVSETPSSGIVDLAAAIFADAVTDIRRRVVEEVLMGKVQDGPASQLAQWGAPSGVTAVPASDYDPYDPRGWNNEPEHEKTAPTPAVADHDFGR